MIKALRNLRAERNVPKEAKIAPILSPRSRSATRLRQGEAVHPEPDAGRDRDDRRPAADRPADSAVAVLPDAEIILPLEGLIDKEAEAARLRKTLADLDKQTRRRSRRSWRNESFVEPRAGRGRRRSSVPRKPSCSPSVRRSLAVLGSGLSRLTGAR